MLIIDSLFSISICVLPLCSRQWKMIQSRCSRVERNQMLRHGHLQNLLLVNILIASVAILMQKQRASISSFVISFVR